MKHHGLNRAIFVDKDGTLIPDIPYNVDPALISLSPGAGEALHTLQLGRYLVVVISNQSGVARGMFKEQALIPVRRHLEQLLAAGGVKLDGFYYCPHFPDGAVATYAIDCKCRKPKPGMLFQAANDLNIDLDGSWMIGDIAADCEAGKRAGCRTILLEKPYDPILDFNEWSRPDLIAASWDEVAQLIDDVGNERAMR